MPDTWQSIAARKQDERARRIPEEWRLHPDLISNNASNLLDLPRRSGLLTAHELRITDDYTATALRDRLATGALSSADVVRAFSKRAAIAQQATNCLTEILFDDALARARELDALLAQTGRPVGPLHGLPISLKDSFMIRGYDASLGIAKLCFRPAEANSALVDLLLALGAVLYCKTNVPQTLAALDTHNNVFGRTRNPAHVHLTPGGSSGGEGALLAMRGSILGVGTDVGGSIRIPAACNKLYGVKPSHGRVPYAGQQGASQQAGASKLAIEPTAGPIATTVRDCEMFLQAIARGAPELLDADVVAQPPWDDQLPLVMNTRQQQRPLRIGIVHTDGHVQPLPPIVHLMQEVAQTLRSSPSSSSSSSSSPLSRPSIHVVDVDAAPILSRVPKTFNGMMSVDGGKAWFDLLDATGEPLSPWLQGRLARRPPKSLDEVRKLQTQKMELRTAFLSVWKESGGHWLTDAASEPTTTTTAAVAGGGAGGGGGGGGEEEERTLDALILPVAPHPIPPIDRWNTVNYTGAFNLLDLSVGVIPVRPVSRRDLHAEPAPDRAPANGWDEINRALWTAVDRNLYLGSPMCVQVVTPRLTERRLLEAMAVIDQALEPLRKSAAAAAADHDYAQPLPTATTSKL